MVVAPVSIVVTTYAPAGDQGKKRIATLERTLDSWNKHLRYEGLIHLIIEDDGSPDEYWPTIRDLGHEVWARGSSWFDHIKAGHGVGASLNRGFGVALGVTSVILYAVDDWMLLQEFDISSWVQLLVERDDVGVVRLGPPHPGNIVEIKPYTSEWQGWAGRICPESAGIIVSERPALWHRRMINQIGGFKEDCSALECEAEYDERYRGYQSPLEVVLALPHPWYHLNPSELSNVDPRTR